MNLKANKKINQGTYSILSKVSFSRPKSTTRDGGRTLTLRQIMSLRISEKMYLLGILLIALGIGFAILSVVFLIKGIIKLNKLKDKDIKIEFKYSETKKKEDNL